MISAAAGKPPALSETQQVTRKTGNIVGRKIWLPKLLYDALPYFYLISGLGAFLATLYISEWFWVLPHYLLFSGACFHIGIMVYRRRHLKRSNASNLEAS
jgi:hypothetical protein